MSSPRSWNDSLQYHRQVARRFPRLDPEEEERLGHLIEEGRRATAALAEADLSPHRRDELEKRERQGREAGEQVVLAHLRFVISVARRYAWRCRFQGLEPADLVQEGNLGLLGAVEAFETGYGRFVTFAMLWVRRGIERALSQQGPVIRAPVHVREKLDRMYRKESRFFAVEGRPPTAEELAAAVGIDTEELARLRLAEQDLVSLSEPVPGGEEETTFREDLIADPHGADFVEQTADRQWLDWLLAGLDERSRRVVEQHLGQERTLAELGKRESLTPQGIRLIEQKALKKVRSRAESRRS